MISKTLFRILLRLFPSPFQDRFGEEMTQLFNDQISVARRRGLAGVIRLWTRTAPGLARAAMMERLESPGSVTQPEGREPMFETLKSDLHFAGRMLWKSPLFTLVAVTCIALGSGAVTTIFSTMNALVLRPLPGADDGDRLIRIERKRPGGDDGVSLSYPWYQQIVQRTKSVDGVIAWGKVSLVLRGGSDPGDAVYGQLVSGNLFNVLGVEPRLGRFFSPDEDQTELSHPVIVVSETYWRTHLGADSSAIGREIMVNSRPFTLIGVAPNAFQGMDTPVKADAWVPLHMQRALRNVPGMLDDASAIWLRAAARLRKGVSQSAARAELAAVGQAIAAEIPGEIWHQYTELRASPLTGLPPDATDALSRFLTLLLGAAVLVLIIASVNVAGMLSARAVERRREMAVRSALGAAHGRLVRQMLTEILVLFALGAAGGALVALAATRALERMPIPGDITFNLLLSPDPRVLGFALLISLVTGLVVGLAPTRQALTRDVSSRLRDASNTTSGKRSLVSSGLIVTQLAISLVLLVGAGLLGRGLLRATRVDPGFDPDGVTTVPLDVDAWGYDQSRGDRFYTSLEERIAGLPGVTAVSYATNLPLNLQSSGDQISLDGAPSDPAGTIPIQQNLITPGYFSVLRIPLVQGRAILREDNQQAGRVAVINQTMANRFWPDGSPLGRTFRYHGQRVTVVGIAKNAKYASLTEPTPLMAYFPLAQEWRARRALLIRSSTSTRALTPALARAIRETDPNAPRPLITSLRDATGIALLPGRVAAIVTGLLGLVGLILSIAGLYGVVAYSAARRTREIGIRMALGARQADVLRLILGDGVRLTAWGIAIGLLLASLGTRLLAGLLFGMSPLDAGTYLLMPTVLAAVAIVASYLPARKAAAAEPWSVLRSE